MARSQVGPAREESTPTRPSERGGKRRGGRTRRRRRDASRLAADMVGKLEARARGSESLVHVESIPPRKAQFRDLDPPPAGPLGRALATQGIERLYIHQAEAVRRARAGEDVIVVTGTASGKTFCYLIPVLESLLEDPGATSLLLFPTKALAQDQLKNLESLRDAEAAFDFLAGTYDGDTPPRQRSKLRDEAQVILTNPDMLHSGILPNHARWARFFSNLRYIVCDEIHVYRGIFGSNVANVMRRLQRICRHYGGSPQFICSSATIANPKDLAERITGRTFALVDKDGAPRGRKHFVLWNPPVLSRTTMDRRSSNLEARDLLLSFLRDGYQGITFVRARQVAEVLLRYCQEELGKDGGGIAKRVRAYRGGYLPEERRAIESALFKGELLGVISTNALELGIDVGSLDLALLVGYPGTIASTWQQAGRAGRTESESLAVLVGHNTPIDQYLMRHPEYFFTQTPENAVVDPDNPHILLGHLRAAAYELPVTVRDEAVFGEYAPAILQILGEFGEVRAIKGRWYYSASGYPAGEISLRNASESVYVIVDTGAPAFRAQSPDAMGGRVDDPPSEIVRSQHRTVRRFRDRRDQAAMLRQLAERGYRVIGTLDEASAFTQLHAQAIYMHEAETYMVEHLDLGERVAYVHRVKLDYYTQSIIDSRIRIVEAEQQQPWRKSETGFGALAVSEKVYLFKKIRFGTRESVGFGPVDLPVQTLETEGCWITPPAEAIHEVLSHGRVPAEGMWGIANVLADVITLHAMCDVMDIGTAQDSRSTGAASIFIYDKYPGGLGFAQKAFGLVEELMQGACDLIRSCPCEAGCPSCVGAPIVAQSGDDPELSGRGRIPDKEAALVLLHRMLEKEPYIPKGERPQPRALPEGTGGEAEETEAARRREIKPLPPQIAQRLRRSLGAMGPAAGRGTPGGGT